MFSHVTLLHFTFSTWNWVRMENLMWIWLKNILLMTKWNEWHWMKMIKLKLNMKNLILWDFPQLCISNISIILVILSNKNTLKHFYHVWITIHAIERSVIIMLDFGGKGPEERLVSARCEKCELWRWSSVSVHTSQNETI